MPDTDKKPPLSAHDVRTMEDLRAFVFSTPMADFVPLKKSVPFKVNIETKGKCSSEMVRFALENARKKLERVSFNGNLGRPEPTTKYEAYRSNGSQD